MKLIFPIVWLETDQRDYYTPFARAFGAVLDRFDFGCSWDLNPIDYIEVNIISQHATDENVAIAIKRVKAALRRQAAKGVIQLG